MRYILLAITFCFLSVFVSAQKNDKNIRDAIIFTNGSKMEGKLMNISKHYVYLKVGAVPFTFHKSKIAFIVSQGVEIPVQIMSTKSDAPANVSDSEYEYIAKRKREYLKNGFYNITYGKLLFSNYNQNNYFYGSYTHNAQVVAIENVSGFQLSQYVGLGIGVGYMRLGYNSATIPVYTEFRGYFSDQKHSAYYNLGIGLNFGLKSPFSEDLTSKPGSYLQPAIGYKFGSDSCAFMVDLGLQFANVTYINDTESYYSKEIHTSQRIFLRLGIML